ncbi:hypothetical protein ACFY19_15690 [Streptosporangium saharense]|uniref:hypothetical protein n=1 Tax=Streptosporangium saharense TaxID=1706840 RepID=UPI0036AF747D
MDEAMVSAERWRGQVQAQGSVEQDREALAQLIEYDHDPFETELYESSSDPQNWLIDRAERSYASQ